MSNWEPPSQPPTSPPGSWGPPSGPPISPPAYEPGPAQPYPAPQPYSPQQNPPHQNLPPPSYGDPSLQYAPPDPFGNVAYPPQPSGGRQRPWWGMGDIALGVLFILLVTVALTMVAAIFVAVGGDDEASDQLLAGVIPTSVLALSLIGQQGSSTIWPFIVSKWKGVGMAEDFGWRFKPVDLLIGPALGIFLLGVAFAVSAIGSLVLGGVTAEETNNAGFLNDAEGSPWLYVLIFGAVVGAPVSEELLFRGLIQRSIQNRAGVVLGVLISTLAFAVIHWIGPVEGSWNGQYVLWMAIGSVGLGLAIAAVVLGRIVPGIIAHAVFNMVGTAGALLT